jgi:hypothetical protein
MKGYSEFKQLIIDKLSALKEIDVETGLPSETALFAEVKKGGNVEFSKYPAATIFNKEGQGSMIDTHKNERAWTFTIFLVHNFNGVSKTKEEAEDILDGVVDITLNSFDKDSSLDGNCSQMVVVPAQFSYTMIQEEFIFAELTITIKDLVSRG